VANSVLPGSTVTFTWLPAKVASSYRLDVGTGVGLTDIYTKMSCWRRVRRSRGYRQREHDPLRLSTVAGTVVQYYDYSYQAATTPPAEGPPEVPTSHRNREVSESEERSEGST